MTSSGHIPRYGYVSRLPSVLALQCRFVSTLGSTFGAYPKKTFGGEGPQGGQRRHRGHGGCGGVDRPAAPPVEADKEHRDSCSRRASVARGGADDRGGTILAGLVLPDGRRCGEKLARWASLGDTPTSPSLSP